MRATRRAQKSYTAGGWRPRAQRPYAAHPGNPDGTFSIHSGHTGGTARHSRRVFALRGRRNTDKLARDPHGPREARQSWSSHFGNARGRITVKFVGGDRHGGVELRPNERFRDRAQASREGPMDARCDLRPHAGTPRCFRASGTRTCTPKEVSVLRAVEGMEATDFEVRHLGLCTCTAALAHFAVVWFSCRRDLTYLISALAQRRRGAN